jgi:alkylation response protein AidB-like acyl-CoA dehydrogenase
MDVRLSAEQQALRDSVALVVGRLGPRTVASLDDAERAAKLDAAVAAAGWRELRAPDDTGAPWATAVEAAVVAEEMARGLADAPFLGPTLATELRRLAGAPAAGVAETVALTPDLGALATTADGGAVAIDAAGASRALSFEPAAMRLVAVTVLSPTAGPDLTRPSGAVDATNATDVSGALAADALDRWTALALALTCADLVGVMRGAVQLARDYAVERQQYGAAIGSFQAVQHLLADAHVAAEGSRSASLHAAWAVDALPPGEAVAAGAVAKAYCSRAARSVCETAIQVHGGIGHTWDCLAHVYLRRALLSVDVLGGLGANLERVLVQHGIVGRS